MKTKSKNKTIRNKTIRNKSKIKKRNLAKSKRKSKVSKNTRRQMIARKNNQKAGAMDEQMEKNFFYLTKKILN